MHHCCLGSVGDLELIDTPFKEVQEKALIGNRLIWDYLPDVIVIYNLAASQIRGPKEADHA